jgi:hypothetical protein
VSLAARRAIAHGEPRDARIIEDRAFHLWRPARGDATLYPLPVLDIGPARIVVALGKGPILFFKRKEKGPERKLCPQCGEQISAGALDCPSRGLDVREAYHPPDYARNADQ